MAEVVVGHRARQSLWWQAQQVLVDQPVEGCPLLKVSLVLQGGVCQRRQGERHVVGPLDEGGAKLAGHIRMGQLHDQVGMEITEGR